MKVSAYQRRLRAVRGFRFKCLLLVFMLTGPVFSGCASQYVTRIPDPDKPLVFPVDHGGHEDAQWEWWYYNGRLETESGKKYDYFFSFFKVYVDGDSVIRIPMSCLTWPFPMFLPFLFGGFSIFDHQEDRYEQRDRSLMPFFWIGDYQNDDLNIRLGANKSWRQADNTFRVQSSIDGYHLDLTLTPERAPLLYGNGHNGTLLPPNTIHRYYSYTRMKTQGTLQKGEYMEKVTGVSWMDHEYGFIYHKDLRSWDWIGMTLDNGMDVVFGLVHFFSGKIVPQSFCTIRFPNGQIEHLEAKSFRMKPVRSWKCSSGITYGIDWEMEVPDFGLKLHTKAIRNDQVMAMIMPPMVFWEGPCDVQGTFKGKPVRGRAFLETWGDYKVPFRGLYRSEMKPRK